MSKPATFAAPLVGGKIMESGKHVDQRGLARAVRPKQAKNLAILYFQIHTIYCYQIAELLGQATRFYRIQWFHLVHPKSSWRNSLKPPINFLAASAL